MERTHTQKSMCVRTLSCEGFVNATGWMVIITRRRKRREGITGDEVSVKVRKVIKKEIQRKVSRGVKIMKEIRNK